MKPLLKDMSTISNAIKVYDPQHRAVVVANVKKLQRVSRKARKYRSKILKTGTQ